MQLTLTETGEIMDLWISAEIISIWHLSHMLDNIIATYMRVYLVACGHNYLVEIELAAFNFV